MFQYLLNTHLRPGRFYLLPKIHKNVLPPPGRPIISAIGSPTEKISEFLDHFLQPFLADMPSFVKDTGHFLYILSKLGLLPQNTILVTLDVTSLYTNVPLLQAKQAVGRVLNRTRPGATEPSNQSLIRLLDFVFTKNVFTISDGNKLHYFVQTNGVSMGSKCAPLVACTYMGEFERQHVYTYHLQPFLWLRYVDDVFCLWNHGDAALQLFVDHLNSREGRIKFTCHSSTTSVEFLDTTVHIKDGVLNTELFIKPTNSLSYLERTSFHPKNTFTSLPYGEFVRARRNCSTAEAFEIYSLKIKSAFQARGYDTSSLEEARLKACSLSRNNLFDAYKQIPDTAIADASSQADTPACMDNAPIHFINTFHPESHHLRNIIVQNYSILESQTPPAVCTKVRLLLDTDARKDCVTSWYTQKSPSPLLQESEVNPLHIVTDSNVSIVPALMRQALSPHIHFKEVSVPKHKYAVRAAILFIVYNAIFVANNMWEKLNAPFTKGFVNISAIYGKAFSKNLWDAISMIWTTTVIHHILQHTSLLSSQRPPTAKTH